MSTVKLLNCEEIMLIEQTKSQKLNLRKKVLLRSDS